MVGGRNWTAAAVAALVSISGIAAGARAEAPDPFRQLLDRARPALVLAPAVDRTETTGAGERLDEVLAAELEGRGIETIRGDRLRAVLRAARIRTETGIGPEDGRWIEEQTGVPWILVPVVGFYDAETPEVGISARLLRAGEMFVERAASAAATGADSKGLFGIGEVHGIDALTRSVVEELIEQLGESPKERADEAVGSPLRVLLVPFDGLSETVHGGAIVTGRLLTELVRAGFAVVEPGAASRTFLRIGVYPVGGIDRTTREVAVETFGVDRIVTGQVGRLERLRPQTVEEALAGPWFRYGARVIDARTGTILWSVEKDADGSDSEWLLGLGRTRSLGDLVSESLRELVDILEGRERKQSLAEAK